MPHTGSYYGHGADAVRQDGRLIRFFDSRGAPPFFDNFCALDRFNFYLAALLMGFGPFVAAYLVDHQWAAADIGFILTAGGLAGLLTQVPAGELLDRIQSKQILVGAGAAAVGLAALIFALRPDFPFVLAAIVAQGATGGILGQGVAAISLGLVGHEALAQRLGRNQRFASLGGLTAAGVMGAVGYLLSGRALFFATAALAVPTLVVLFRIRSSDIDLGRSRGSPDPHPTNPKKESRTVLFRDRRLLTFAACLLMFQIANAPMLPLLAGVLMRAEGRYSWLSTSALIVVPQIIVALLAPWVGRTADSWGRQPLLVIGLGAVVVRSVLFASTTNQILLVVVQALDGLSGATLGVLTAVVIADLTTGTGRFNLAQGVVGTLSGIGASFSTFLVGLVVGRFGHAAGFWSMGAVALAAVAAIWLFMPETKPSVVEQKANAL